jgi:RimJ/RimL family protein N-acetyltransferase
MARPLVARAAADNVASLRVLEKCGFVRVGADGGFSNARGEDVDEIIFRLRE